jgi:hypothetical protein
MKHPDCMVVPTATASIVGQSLIICDCRHAVEHYDLALNSSFKIIRL